MMARRWWLFGAAAAAVVIAAALLFVWALPQNAGSDCASVHELVDFNRAHHEAVTAQSEMNENVEIPLSDYQDWASRIHEFAADISDPQLAPHARKVSDLAEQTVEIVKRARTDNTPPTAPGPPAWVQDYAKMNVEFDREMSALEQACRT
jgi:hypothetical protein